MALDRFNRRRSYIVLGVSLLGEFVLFGVRVSYSPSVYWCIVIGQLAVISGAAWKLGASAVRAETENRRRFAAAGGLLLMPWILTSFLAGYRPPWEATAAENKARYLILLPLPMPVPAAFAASLGRVLWPGRRATRTFVTTGLMAAVCLAMRGLVFALPAHWYGMPGFIAGIPAIPWILPGLLGIVLLRRAGDVDKADAS